MSTITPGGLIDQLTWRYATKLFDPAKTIPADVWSALERSLVLTPSSYGLQPWKFVVITDTAMKAKLRPVSWNQAQVTECSHHVVFCALVDPSLAHIDRFVAHTAHVRNTPAGVLDGFRGMLAKTHSSGYMTTEWSARQCYIALGQFMAACAVLGVDACPMEGIDRGQYDEILGLKAQGYTAAVACPAGYRREGDKYASLAKVRFDAADVVTRI